MFIRINFRKKANGPKMRVAKELRRTKQELKDLKEAHENLRRKYRSTMRSIQRMNKKSDKHSNTPSSKAKRLTENMDLSRQQRLTVRKELVFANAVCDEIKDAAHRAPIKAKKILQNLVAGNVLKKYKLLQMFGKKTVSSNQVNTTILTHESVPDSVSIDTQEKYHAGDYVAASYLNRWYIGEIMNCDDEDNTYEITFLEKRKKMFQWPTRPDEIWVNYDDILCKVSTPVASGKSKRMLVLPDNDFERVERLFDKE
ncbi:hypothetical protein MAR_031852 [Mya arenaria]|uniref:Uncharacterized protein n=1 Tax=Mya arenaria TaxID=6604 RepID=A0ABY7F9A1_MYAAR|nr:hypothetical protein MAR_031852 [Mya arenaria]